MELVTEHSLVEGVRYLCARDNDLNEVISKYGTPPLWNRRPGFATLLRIILEQQVSLASAAACYDKLEQVLGNVEPEKFIALSDRQLKETGFSRQKAAYGKNLAQLIISGQLDLGVLPDKPDREVNDMLIRVKGIGRWTIDIYLLMALQRRDIWPAGDLALIKALAVLKQISPGENGNIINKITDHWIPWRSVAARILWHFYLSNSGKKVKKMIS